MNKEHTPPHDRNHAPVSGFDDSGREAVGWVNTAVHGRWRGRGCYSMLTALTRQRVLFVGNSEAVCDTAAVLGLPTTPKSYAATHHKERWLPIAPRERAAHQHTITKEVRNETHRISLPVKIWMLASRSCQGMRACVSHAQSSGHWPERTRPPSFALGLSGKAPAVTYHVVSVGKAP